MAKKTTLADIANILKSKKTKGDTSFWGVVNSVITDSQGNTTGYNVSLDGTATGTVKCNKVVGAEVGDQVLVTLRSNGEAVVIATKGGDADVKTVADDLAENYSTTEEVEEMIATMPSGTKIYYQTSEPTGGTYKVGDTWFDTDGGYQIHQWDGTQWVAAQFGSVAIADNSITAAKILAGAVDTSELAAGAVTANKLAVGAVVKVGSDTGYMAELDSTSLTFKYGYYSGGTLYKDTLATFGYSTVNLGQTSVASAIKMCSDKLYIKGELDSSSYNMRMQIGMNNYSSYDKFMFLSTMTEAQWSSFNRGNDVPYAALNVNCDGSYNYQAELNAWNQYSGATISCDTDSSGSSVSISADKIYLNGSISGLDVPISGKFAIQESTRTLSSSHAAGDEINFSDKSLTKSGYYPLGVVGIETNAFRLACNAYLTNRASGSCKLKMTGTAAGGSIASGRTITAKVLWVKV